MNATMTQWTNVLTARAACCAAVAFARKHESFQSAWDACERGDWMLWWIGRTIAAFASRARVRGLRCRT